ncbi:ATP-binding cassette domain-containing protein [Mycoplasma phocoeninasale]|uniref:ATP-binding cassette domain-containing protein n=1 Tax=Mycoplasma phocoeninasale TaxID=2726117 RepID=A0A858U361_9MOLU|nr:ATP-binding cassette domain-containing protein [Mycoplasma phocoeninasale]QJG66411.1 ATP-binding cassette domain-containing protein [Mycoplasma phocoeninasale]
MWIGKQIDIKDCGIFVLQAFFREYYNKLCDINYLKVNAKYDENGISLFSFKELENKIGLKIEILEGDFESFLKINIDQEYATILNLEQGQHYVIFESKTRKGFWLVDSVRGRYFLANDELERYYNNFIIIVKKDQDNNFQKNSIPKQNYSIPVKYEYHKWIVIFLLVILTQLFSFVGSFYSKYIFEALFDSKQHNKFLIIFVIFLWIVILRFLMSWLNKILKFRVSSNYEKRIYEKLQQDISRAPEIQLNKISQNEFLSTISLVPQIVEYKTNLLLFSLNNLVIFLSAGIILGILNKIILYIAICYCLIVFIISLLGFQRIRMNYSRLIIKKINQIQNINGVFLNWNNRWNQEYMAWKIQDFKKILDDSINYQQLIFKIDTGINTFNDFLFTVVQMFILYYGAILFIAKKINIANLSLISTIFTLLNSPTKNMSSLISGISINKIGILRLKFLFNLNIKSEKNLVAIECPEINTIAFKNLEFSYGSIPIFQNLNYEIDNHTHLIGSNGSGKSTLLKILWQLYSHTSGDILIDGISIKNINLKQWREQIYLNNDSEYFDSDNLLNIITQNDAKKVEIFIDAYQRYNLAEIFNIFKLNLRYKIENYGTNLSSGQQQFISIMRLFCKKYRVICLDEIFENFSEESFHKISEKIRKFQDNCLFIEISHVNRFIINNSYNKLVF